MGRFWLFSGEIFSQTHKYTPTPQICYDHNTLWPEYYYDQNITMTSLCYDQNTLWAGNLWVKTPWIWWDDFGCFQEKYFHTHTKTHPHYRYAMTTICYDQNIQWPFICYDQFILWPEYLQWPSYMLWPVYTMTSLYYDQFIQWPFYTMTTWEPLT